MCNKTNLLAFSISFLPGQTSIYIFLNKILNLSIIRNCFRACMDVHTHILTIYYYHFAFKKFFLFIQKIKAIRMKWNVTWINCGAFRINMSAFIHWIYFNNNVKFVCVFETDQANKKYGGMEEKKRKIVEKQAISYSKSLS